MGNYKFCIYRLRILFPITNYWSLSGCTYVLIGVEKWEMIFWATWWGARNRNEKNPLPPVRFELTTPGLRDQCSTTELKRLSDERGVTRVPLPRGMHEVYGTMTVNHDLYLRSYENKRFTLSIFTNHMNERTRNGKEETCGVQSDWRDSAPSTEHHWSAHHADNMRVYDETTWETRE